jgi:Lrp/AsnC family leucine-responsive transcriptional regulator
MKISLTYLHLALACRSHRMPPANEFLLDAIDHKILAELQSNARLPFAELGRRVALSTPAVTERVRRMEDAGIILQYVARVDPVKVGLPLRAFIKITVPGDRLPHFKNLAQRVPEVRECHRVTGAESYILQVAVRDLPHLEAVIDSLTPYVATNTSMILASPVPWNPVVPAAALKR